MPRRRVFISSVITGFEDFRAAAKLAIETLRQEPVMAEHFGAKPYSPRVACLEGVRSSDVYVGIFGERYGYVSDKDVSVTEEEFEEARRAGRTILCFLQDGTKGPRQAKFLERVKSYENGLLLDLFSSPEELKDKLVRALYDEIGQPGMVSLDESGARELLDRERWGSRTPAQHDTWFGVVIFPARQGENYLSPVDLGKRSFQDRLLQPAVFGPAAFFGRELRMETGEDLERITFRQQEEHGTLRAALEIHCDGTLVFGATPTGERGHGYSMVRSHVIDEDACRDLLEKFTLYAEGFYSNLERSAPISKLFLGMSFTGIGYKMFGRVPSVEPRSIQMGSGQIPDPFQIPGRPQAVARAGLSNATKLAEEMIALAARAFRAAGGYYGSSKL